MTYLTDGKVLFEPRLKSQACLQVMRLLKCIIYYYKPVHYNLLFFWKKTFIITLTTELAKSNNVSFFQSMQIEIHKCTVGYTYSHLSLSKLITWCHIITSIYHLAQCRCVLCQPGRWQGPYEDGPGAGASRPCQLPARGASARRCAQAHQPACPGSHHGVRHLQCHSPGVRTYGKDYVLFSTF